MLTPFGDCPIQKCWNKTVSKNLDHKTLPLLSVPKNSFFSQETAPFIHKFDHPKLKNGFPRPKDYISNTYITSKTKAVTYGSVSWHWWTSGVISVNFITMHAAVCINTEHFTKLKQYHNSLHVVALTLFKRQHKRVYFSYGQPVNL